MSSVNASRSFSGQTSCSSLGLPTIDHAWDIKPATTDRQTHNEETYKHIRNGDVIEFREKDSPIGHFGIANVEKKPEGIVEKFVIHFMTKDSKDIGEGIYKREHILPIIGERWMRIFEDDQLQPLAVRATIDIAKSKLGKEEQYNLYDWNCEHFALKCKYGKSVSRQIAQVAKRLGEGATRLGGYVITRVSAFSHKASESTQSVDG